MCQHAHGTFFLFDTQAAWKNSQGLCKDMIETGIMAASVFKHHIHTHQHFVPYYEQLRNNKSNLILNLFSKFSAIRSKLKKNQLTVVSLYGQV